MCLREFSDGAKPFISATAIQLTPKLYYTKTTGASFVYTVSGMGNISTSGYKSIENERKCADNYNK